MWPPLAEDPPETRQHNIAVHSVEMYNATPESDEIRLFILAVDTHGYTNAAMVVAKGLDFDLHPRLRNPSERKPCALRGFDALESLELAAM